MWKHPVESKGQLYDPCRSHKCGDKPVFGFESISVSPIYWPVFCVFIAKVCRWWKEKRWPEAQRKRPKQHCQLDSSTFLNRNRKQLNRSSSCKRHPLSFHDEKLWKIDVFGARKFCSLLFLAFLHKLIFLFLRNS